MVIAKSNILQYLISEKLELNIFALAVEQGIEIEELSYNRSRMLKIKYYEQNEKQSEHPITLFIKQPLDIYDSEYSMPIIREAYFYQVCNQIDLLKEFLPDKRYLSFNSIYYILIRRWIVEVYPFRDSFDSKFLDNIGWLLGLFHKELNKEKLDKGLFQQLISLNGGRPSPFLSVGILDDNYIQFHDTRLYEFITHEVNVEIVGILKTNNLRWETSTLIHSDLNENNVLVRAEKGKQKVHIVDWEYVVWGDIAWDIASILFFLILRREFDSNKNYKEIFGLFWQKYRKQQKHHKKIFDKDWQQKVMILVGIKFLDYKSDFEIELLSSESVIEREQLEKKIKVTRNIAEYFIVKQPISLFF